MYYVSNFIEISTCRLDGSDCRVLLDSSIVISGVENIAIGKDKQTGWYLWWVDIRSRDFIRTKNKKSHNLLES